jgi:hypothetical protein
MYGYTEDNQINYNYLFDFAQIHDLKDSCINYSFYVAEYLITNDEIFTHDTYDAHDFVIESVIDIKKILINKIINKSIDILIKNNITNTSLEYGLVSYHRYKNDMKTPIDVHIDDNGAILGNVNTVIFYLKKDIFGGNLNIYQEFDEDEDLNPILIETIDTKPSKDNIKIIYFEGNVYHSVDEIIGDGIRESIVVHLKANR